ncbi:MAG: glutamyl-tRNA reductase [Chloroflexi bacterium]|nr:glutamyl-tRNA reductase [Chloroflexota bacterium]
MVILAVGLSHKTAPLEVREKLSVSRAQLPVALDSLKKYVKHGVILSTCNRTEVYAEVGHTGSGMKNIARFLSDFFDTPDIYFSPHLYTFSQSFAIRHLFMVAAGLDSMVVGEDQVLGQVKYAYETAQSRGALEQVLYKLFRHAIQVGKAVRQQTKAGKNGRSVSAVAVELARETLGSLGGRTVLIIGAGDVGKLTGKALVRDWGCRAVIVSRTFDRAVELAQLVGGEAVPMERLPEMLITSDMVISSTASPTFVLNRENVEAAMVRRNHRPLLLIDIAVPRDINPEVSKIRNVTLRDIDDLRKVAEASSGGSEELAKAEAIVEAEVDKFIAWWDSLEVVPTIKALRRRAELIRQAEIEKALRLLNGIRAEDKGKIEALTLAIVNKMLHPSLVRLKKREDGKDYVRAAQELFGLQDKAY